jgi:hypothetical protein
LRRREPYRRYTEQCDGKRSWAWEPICVGSNHRHFALVSGYIRIGQALMLLYSWD